MTNATLCQQAWEWIEDQPNIMVSDVARELDISKPKARNVVDELVRKGCLHAVVTSSKPRVYAVKNGVQPTFGKTKARPPINKTGRQRMWSAMRWRQSQPFTAQEIVHSCGSTASISTVTRYLSSLVKYGYAMRLRQAKGGQSALYRLLVTHGHQYPQITKKGLYDPNKKRLVPAIGNQS